MLKYFQQTQDAALEPEDDETIITPDDNDVVVVPDDGSTDDDDGDGDGTVDDDDDGDDSEEDDDLPDYMIIDVDVDQADMSTESFQLEQALQLLDTATEFGATSAVMSYGYRMELFSNTPLEVLSMESLAELDQETSLESLVNNALDKVKGWAASAVSKTKTMITSIMSKLDSCGKWAADKARSIGARIRLTAKTHPYATVAATLTAALAIAGVIAVATGCINPSVLKAPNAVTTICQRLNSAMNKIRWPFGKKMSVVPSGHALEFKTAAMVGMSESGTSVVPVTADKAGWTPDKLKGILTMLDKTVSAISSASKSFGAAVVRLASSFGSSIKSAGMDVVGKIDQAFAKTQKSDSHVIKTVGVMSVGFLITNLLKGVSAMIKTVVFGAMAMVRRVTTALLGGDAGKSPEPEAA